MKYKSSFPKVPTMPASKKNKEDYKVPTKKKKK